MTREPATFTTGQLLTLATGRLACDISEVYSAINAVTGINPMTHQIGRIMTELKPGLLRVHPWLENVTPPDPNTDNIEQATLTWVSEVTAEHGDTHIVPLLSDQVTYQDPLTELRDTVGEDTTTVVLAPATKSEFIPITPLHHRGMRYIVGDRHPAADDARTALDRFTRDITGDTKLTAAVLGGSACTWDLDPATGCLALSLRFPNYTNSTDSDNPFAPTRNSWAIEFRGGPAHGEKRIVEQRYDEDTKPDPIIDFSVMTVGEEPTRISYELTAFNLRARRWVYTTKDVPA